MCGCFYSVADRYVTSGGTNCRQRRQIDATHVGVGRRGHPLRVGSFNRPRKFRNTERRLQTRAARTRMVFAQVLQFADAAFNFLPSRLCDPWQLRDFKTWRSSLTWLYSPTPTKCRDVIFAHQATGARSNNHCGFGRQSDIRQAFAAVTSQIKTKKYDR